MITVFGSINIDLVTPVARLPRPGETVTGTAYTVVPGGKGANQALAAARAGARVRMVGCIGRDAFAQAAVSTLIRDGVDIDAVQRCEAPTGCAMIAVDQDGENLIIVASGANASATADQVQCDWLDETAIVLLQMEVPADENWAVIRRARDRGAKVILNAAPGAPVPTGAIRSLDVLIMNESEARIVGESLDLPTTDAREAARRMAESHGVTAIVTLGARGAAAYSKEGAWTVGALALRLVDTTAAGDAFTGGLAAALEQGASFGDAFHRAAVAGALACGVAGAQPSLPDLADIERHLARLEPPRFRATA